MALAVLGGAFLWSRREPGRPQAAAPPGRILGIVEGEVIRAATETDDARLLVTAADEGGRRQRVLLADRSRGVRAGSVSLETPGIVFTLEEVPEKSDVEIPDFGSRDHRLLLAPLSGENPRSLGRLRRMAMISPGERAVVWAEMGSPPGVGRAGTGTARFVLRMLEYDSADETEIGPAPGLGTLLGGDRSGVFWTVLTPGAPGSRTLMRWRQGGRPHPLPARLPASPAPIRVGGSAYWLRRSSEGPPAWEVWQAGATGGYHQLRRIAEEPGSVLRPQRLFSIAGWLCIVSAEAMGALPAEMVRVPLGKETGGTATLPLSLWPEGVGIIHGEICAWGQAPRSGGEILVRTGWKT